NLNSATSRNRFATATIQRADLDAAEADAVAKELRQQLLAAASDPPVRTVAPAPGPTPTEDDPRQTELAKTPPETRRAAEELLDDPCLLDRVSADIGALGVAGEEVNRLILYLVGTSAQLDQPLAAITRGGSASGKSFLAEKVGQLFPPEVVLRA